MKRLQSVSPISWLESARTTTSTLLGDMLISYRCFLTNRQNSGIKRKKKNKQKTTEVRGQVRQLLKRSQIENCCCCWKQQKASHLLLMIATVSNMRHTDFWAAQGKNTTVYSWVTTLFSLSVFSASCLWTHLSDSNQDAHAIGLSFQGHWWHKSCSGLNVNARFKM